MRKLVCILPVLVILMFVKVDSRNHDRFARDTNTTCPDIEELHKYERAMPADGETPAAPTEDCPEIPEGYCQFETSPHAYKLHTDVKMNWNNARKHCQSEHGDLVVIENGAQYDIVRFMGRHYLGKGIVHFHLGFKRESVDFPWVTINNHRMPFAKWAKGEPNNYGSGEHCGAFMSIYNQTNGFNDVYCRQHFHFMCEVKVLPTCPLYAN